MRQRRRTSVAVLALFVAAPAARAQAGLRAVDMGATRSACTACAAVDANEADGDALRDLWARQPALALLAVELLVAANVLAALGRRPPAARDSGRPSGTRSRGPYAAPATIRGTGRVPSDA